MINNHIFAEKDEKYTVYKYFGIGENVSVKI